MARETANGIENADSGSPIIFSSDGEVRDSDSESGIPIIEPATLSGEPDSEPQPRKRGRPKGSRNSGTTARAQKETGQTVSDCLLTIHWMLAKLTKIEQLELDPTEAKKLGEALARVESFYTDKMISEKTMAWINLGAVAGAVYGPRIMAIDLSSSKNGKAKTVEMPTPSVQ